MTLAAGDFAGFVGAELSEVVGAFGFVYQVEQRPLLIHHIAKLIYIFHHNSPVGVVCTDGGGNGEPSRQLGKAEQPTRVGLISLCLSFKIHID